MALLAVGAAASTHPVHAQHAIVVSVHELASHAGAEIMQAGGNAIDASLAMAAMAFVALPAQCGPGGDVFAVYHRAATRTFLAVHGSGWGPDAYWAVFTSAPRLVPDHQHMDASNFVLSRGEDALIVDPSPYGSRSTLTGNALTVDSDVVLKDYKPSQTPWSTAELPWARGTAAGVVAASPRGVTLWPTTSTTPFSWIWKKLGAWRLGSVCMLRTS